MNWDGIVSISILLFIFILIWSKMKKQSLKETAQEIREIFGGKQEE